MFRSLFGELTNNSHPRPTQPAAAPAFADTAVLEDAPATVPHVHDPKAQDVFVSGSPAVSIREHFASSRADLDRASSMITLLDPSRLWAASVIKALSDATGAPIERLNLRERGTLRTLAMVERTAVRLRTSTNALRVYHADVRSLGPEHDEIVNALAERSHLAVVIVGAMQPHSLDLLLRSLLDATRQPHWRCPRLAFLIPPGATESSRRILARDWPARLHVSVIAEPLTGASSTWNTVLAAWDEVPDEAPARAPAPAPLDASTIARTLRLLASTEGVQGCGVVDLERGDLLMDESRSMSSAGLAALARAMADARSAHGRAAGPAQPVPDEIQLTSSAGIDLLRVLPPPARLGLVLRLDRQHANLPLVRGRMLEVEKALV